MFLENGTLRDVEAMIALRAGDVEVATSSERGHTGFPRVLRRLRYTIPVPELVTISVISLSGSCGRTH